MTEPRFTLQAAHSENGITLAWMDAGAPILTLPHPVVLEIGQGDPHDHNGERHAFPYGACEATGDGRVGVAEVEAGGVRFRVRDAWHRVDGESWRLDRTIEIVQARPGAGFRLLLDLRPTPPRAAYGDFRYFAPPAVYDLNDLNEDGVDDYLDTRTLVFREDRLNARSVLAYSESAKLGFALSRADRPEFDPIPERATGQTAFFQRTDIGSLGVAPCGADDSSLSLLGAYPFVERDRSHALLVKARSPWGAFWPADEAGETLAVSYLVQLIPAADMHAALWGLWTGRLRDLAPEPVALAASHDEIARLRLDALMRYHIEEADAPFAAGFVTNCHPQDGRQISNVIQYGFTGQNVLNAYNVMRAIGDGEAELRRKALRVIDFFVDTVIDAPKGLSYSLYNADTRRFGSWWTGLLLPLAYAKPGSDLESLMGPVYNNLRDVIESLRGRDGAYLRCAVEEYDALIQAYEHERARGVEQERWLAVCLVFGEFLLAAQWPDGSWSRAYTFDGQPIEKPGDWFGQTMVQQKSSTASAVPFLLALHRRTGEKRWLDSAERAGRFAKTHFVDRVKFNGGIHDSIYAKPQLVDGESIMFSLRALMQLHQATGEPEFLDGAVRAARLVVTWVCLWDVPLAPGTTLERFGFRSTGWAACDSPGAGYIHPMGLMPVVDLVEFGLHTGDETYLRVAHLLHQACNETVAVPGKDWGYAFPGLQEEGLLISWWFADDPMFSATAFGGRGKGEGNKTCLPWISAVSLFTHHELRTRYGTTDIEAIRMRVKPDQQ